MNYYIVLTIYLKWGNITFWHINKSWEWIVNLWPRNTLFLYLVIFPVDSQLSMSQLLGTNGTFDLSWQPNANTSRGYVVEWVPTGCSGLCPVNWEKVPEKDSSFTVKPGESFKFIYKWLIYWNFLKFPVLLKTLKVFGHIKMSEFHCIR